MTLVWGGSLRLPLTLADVKTVIGRFADHEEIPKWGNRIIRTVEGWETVKDADFPTDTDTDW